MLNRLPSIHNEDEKSPLQGGPSRGSVPSPLWVQATPPPPTTHNHHFLYLCLTLQEHIIHPPRPLPYIPIVYRPRQPLS